MKFDFGTYGRHCEVDTTEAVPATVSGSIPDYMYGEFIFNGNGLSKIGDSNYRHCFDPASILQKVTVSPSGCRYMSRFLQSTTLARNREAGAIVVPEFGTRVQAAGGGGIFGKLKKMADVESMMSDNTAINVGRFNNRLYAIGVTPYYHELDEKTLETKSRVNLYKDEGIVVTCPHLERLGTGALACVGQSIGVTGAKYCVIEYPDGDGSPRVVARISPRWRLHPCFMHSFGVSERFLVLFEQPMSVGLVDAVKDIINSTCFVDSVKWLPEESVIVTLLDTKTWKTYKKKFSFEPQFILHFCNCYEDTNGDLVVDFMSYKGPDVLHDFYLDVMRAPKEVEKIREHFKSSLMRIILPLSADDSKSEIAVTPQVLAEVPMENPRINPNYLRRQHRYVYGVGITDDDCARVSKVDCMTGEEKRFVQDGIYPGEVIYVPRPSEQAEDDGTLAVFCLFSAKKDLGCLLLLSASDLTEVARITFNAVDTITNPAHGQFFPATA
ncbi:carotenoid isomerooxygenase-like [Hyalella azteca]|uniref:Carotenoid isomerooxygenase-like n=1 Tax=Hyalella azteca TaxID=294128 RepID=A0A8B7N052_HYAAZ|nr:carotenoid isomerooxygenase-like [Hyalella azteca]